MTLKLITDARPDDFGEKLDKGFKHLLDRCMSNGEMTIAEETAALKACMAYYETTQQKPGETEGAIQWPWLKRLPNSRLLVRGGASRDGGTIDQDADAF